MMTLRIALRGFGAADENKGPYQESRSEMDTARALKAILNN
jgi:hypothetical protein